MSEKSFSAELKDILIACTFADLARAIAPSSGRWRAHQPYAQAATALETLPKIVRKRFANLKVFDSAALVVALTRVGEGRVRRWL
jgi:hypothetical protein